MAAPVVPAPASADTFDARWSKWQAASVVQDRLWNRRAAAAAAVALAIVSAVLVLALVGR